MWVTKQKGAHFLEHYLDDFITIGEPFSTECLSNLEVLLDTCRSLGVPIAEDKTLITFLSIIEIDSVAQELRLPDDKRTRISSSLQTWSTIAGKHSREMQPASSGQGFMKQLQYLQTTSPHETECSPQIRHRVMAGLYLEVAGGSTGTVRLFSADATMKQWFRSYLSGPARARV